MASRALVAIGVLLLTWFGFESLQAAIYRHDQLASFQRLRDNPSSARPGAAPASVKMGAVIATLEIPRLRFSEVVAEGEREATLGVAIGHLPDTPLPWQAGNTALAGHRNTHFRPLKDLRIGDTLHLFTRYGDFQYRVVRTLVVEPEDVWVLRAEGTKTLTLVTCYPFGYIGRAPQRFVVLAESQ